MWLSLRVERQGHGRLKPALCKTAFIVYSHSNFGSNQTLVAVHAQEFSQNLGYSATMTQNPMMRFPGFKNAFEFIKIPNHLSHGQYDYAAKLLHDINNFSC